MKQERFQISLGQEQKKELEKAAREKGVSLAEFIRDILKESLLTNAELRQDERMVRYQLTLPAWLKEALVAQAESAELPLARYIRELCREALHKERLSENDKS